MSNSMIPEKKNEILEIIENSNLTTREHLTEMLHLSDRKIRCSIESLRRDGFPIINGTKSGYRLADDEAEYRNWRDREVARAKSILYTIGKMDRAYKDCNQLMVADLEDLLV